MRKGVSPRILRFLRLVVFYICLLGLYLPAASADLSSAGQEERIFGVTVDDSWYGEVETDAIVEALRAMPVRPAVRIVMSNELQASEYRELFSAISAVATVMAAPVDSYYMSAYMDVGSYLDRFRAAYEYLSPYVDIWEIGNEINGVDWILQDPSLIVAKVLAANDYIREQGGQTALTVYYTDPADQDLFYWLERHVPARLAENVDFAFVSYYEDDNDGYAPDWEAVFGAMARFFPNSKIGIGECGNTAADATDWTKIAMAASYYGMERFCDRFVGGFFWWNWVQDCVPHQGNPVFAAINSVIAQSVIADAEQPPRD